MTKPRILLFDVETMAAKYYVWNPYNADNIPIKMMISPSRMIMWAAKWLGHSRIMQMDERAGRKAMFAWIADLLREADMVVTYNGDRFDIPWVQGGVVEHRLPALPQLTSLDLYKPVKKLRYQSSKLEYVAPLLKIGQKVKNAGWELWRDVDSGKSRAWNKMRTYNRGDVMLLESGYGRLAPYIANHPRLYPKRPDRPSCRTCDGTQVQFRGRYATRTAMYDRYQCQRCGTWDKVPRKVKA